MNPIHIFFALRHSKFLAGLCIRGVFEKYLDWCHKTHLNSKQHLTWFYLQYLSSLMHSCILLCHTAGRIFLESASFIMGLLMVSMSSKWVPLMAPLTVEERKATRNKWNTLLLLRSRKQDSQSHVDHIL